MKEREKEGERERKKEPEKERERDENGGKGVPHSVPFITIKTKRDENEHQESDLKPKLQNISRQLHRKLIRKIFRKKLYN